VIAKRFLIFVCACSMAVLLWPSDAAAQRGGGGGSRGGGSHGGGGGQPAHPSGGHGGGPGPSGGHGGYPSGGGYYRPYYGGYRGYYGYRPYYYSPYWYNGFYASFYFGLGWAPYYAGYYAYGAPYGYYGAYGYPCCGYPYPGYAYAAWSSARLEVRPREAQVYVDGYFVGQVDEFDGVFQRLDLPAGEHELAVYMPGYHTYREKTLFRPGEGYHYKAMLEPLPPGAPQDPKPQPSPNAAPANQQQPPPYGDPNYGGNAAPQFPYGQPPPERPEPGRTQPMPDRGVERHDSAGFGTLNLKVQPGDAAVTIDGEKWDSTEGGSRLVVQLAVGPHRIEVRKDGFRTYSGTIDIRPGEPQTLNVVLPQQD